MKIGQHVEGYMIDSDGERRHCTSMRGTIHQRHTSIYMPLPQKPDARLSSLSQRRDMRGIMH